MRKADGYKKNFPVLGAQFPCMVFLEGGGAFSQIDYHIQRAACQAVNNLGMISGRQLKMQASQYAVG